MILLYLCEFELLLIKESTLVFSLLKVNDKIDCLGPGYFRLKQAILSILTREEYIFCLKDWFFI